MGRVKSLPPPRPPDPRRRRGGGGGGRLPVTIGKKIFIFRNFYFQFSFLNFLLLLNLNVSPGEAISSCGPAAVRFEAEELICRRALCALSSGSRHRVLAAFEYYLDRHAAADPDPQTSGHLREYTFQMGACETPPLIDTIHLVEYRREGTRFLVASANLRTEYYQRDGREPRKRIRIFIPEVVERLFDDIGRSTRDNVAIHSRNAALSLVISLEKLYQELPGTIGRFNFGFSGGFRWNESVPFEWNSVRRLDVLYSPPPPPAATSGQPPPLHLSYDPNTLEVWLNAQDGAGGRVETSLYFNARYDLFLSQCAVFRPGEGGFVTGECQIRLTAAAAATEDEDDGGGRRRRAMTCDCLEPHRPVHLLGLVTIYTLLFLLLWLFSEIRFKTDEEAVNIPAEPHELDIELEMTEDEIRQRNLTVYRYIITFQFGFPSKAFDPRRDWIDVFLYPRSVPERFIRARVRAGRLAYNPILVSVHMVALRSKPLPPISEVKVGHTGTHPAARLYMYSLRVEAERERSVRLYFVNDFIRAGEERILPTTDRFRPSRILVPDLTFSEELLLVDSLSALLMPIILLLPSPGPFGLLDCIGRMALAIPLGGLYLVLVCPLYRVKFKLAEIRRRFDSADPTALLGDGPTDWIYTIVHLVFIIFSAAMFGLCVTLGDRTTTTSQIYWMCSVFCAVCLLLAGWRSLDLCPLLSSGSETSLPPLERLKSIASLDSLSFSHRMRSVRQRRSQLAVEEERRQTSEPFEHFRTGNESTANKSLSGLPSAVARPRQSSSSSSVQKNQSPTSRSIPIVSKKSSTTSSNSYLSSDGLDGPTTRSAGLD